MTFSHALEQYLIWAVTIRRHAEPTINVRRAALQRCRAFLAKAKGIAENELVLDDFTVDAIESWIASSTGRKGSASVLVAIDATRSFGARCVKKGWLPSSPAHQIKKPAADPPRRDKVRDAEVAKMFAWATNLDDDFARTLYPALLASMVLAGLRATEALSLRLSDLDSVQGTIHVRDGKGKKSRTVAPAEQFWPFYEAWKQFRATVAPAHDYVFLTQVRGGAASRERLVYGDSFRRIMKKLADAAGIGDGRKITAHCYRHNFAMNLYRNGATLKSIGEALGHSNEEVTFRYLRDDLECGKAGKIYGARPELENMARLEKPKTLIFSEPASSESSPPVKPVKRRTATALPALYEIGNGVYTDTPTTKVSESAHGSEPVAATKDTKEGRKTTPRAPRGDSEARKKKSAASPSVVQMREQKRRGPKPKLDDYLALPGWEDLI